MLNHLKVYWHQSFVTPTRYYIKYINCDLHDNALNGEGDKSCKNSYWSGNSSIKLNVKKVSVIAKLNDQVSKFT